MNAGIADPEVRKKPLVDSASRIFLDDICNSKLLLPELVFRQLLDLVSGPDENMVKMVVCSPRARTNHGTLLI